MELARTCLASLLIASTAAAQTTLVAHYKLDETSGTVAADSSGNGHDGTYTGGYTLGQAGTCANSTAVAFNGVDSYVEIPTSPTLDALVSDFTVAAWINPNIDQLHRIFSAERIGCGAGSGWAFGPNAGAGIRFTTLGVQDFNNNCGCVSTGTWQHMAIVFDAALVAHFYLDGQPVGTISGVGAANVPANGRWFIGVLDLTCLSEWFDGLIDDVQVYSGSATDADILSLFQNPCSVIGGGGLGTSYCGPAIPNSTNLPAAISAVGSVVAADDDVTLTCTNMPNNQFGYFLNSMSSGFVFPVPNSQGALCITGAIGRYNQSVFNTGATGMGQIVLSLPSTPTPTGNVAIMSGETWNFTCWFRDANPSPTSNFSDGVMITFQ